ncbi:hypothetical protein BH23BAC1_BH23BAC1_37560 [soil metagenome]
MSRIITILAGVYQDLEEYENAKLFFKKATKLSPKSELASLGLYLSIVKLGKYKEAINELERYLILYPANRYKTTLIELLTDLEGGYAQNFKETILFLAKKNNIKLGIG